MRLGHVASDRTVPLSSASQNKCLKKVFIEYLAQPCSHSTRCVLKQIKKRKEGREGEWGWTERFTNAGETILSLMLRGLLRRGPRTPELPGSNPCSALLPYRFDLGAPFPWAAPIPFPASPAQEADGKLPGCPLPSARLIGQVLIKHLNRS